MEKIFRYSQNGKNAHAFRYFTKLTFCSMVWLKYVL